MYIDGYIDHRLMVEVSAGIILSEGKILAMKKGVAKYDYLSNKYEFPGGKVEPGEEPIETLKRELFEELKADISKSTITHVADIFHEYPDFSVVIHSYLVRADNFDFSMTEHVGYKWISPEEINGLDWVEADRKIIRKLMGII